MNKQSVINKKSYHNEMNEIKNLKFNSTYKVNNTLSNDTAKYSLLMLLIMFYLIPDAKVMFVSILD